MRAVAGIFKRVMSGIEQWCPARIAIFCWSKSDAMSCGCMPSMPKERMLLCFSGSSGPKSFIEGNFLSSETAYASSFFSCSWICAIPISLRYFIARESPIAPAIFGVPASNFHGKSFHVEYSLCTSRIMSPP